MSQYRPKSYLHDDVAAERAVKRYRVAGERLSERQRLALAAFASVFGREDGDALIAGGLAHHLGDGNGWTAATTIRALLRRGWIEHRAGPMFTSTPWIRYYRVTHEGLRVLAELDAQHRAEVCPGCGGETELRDRYAYFDLPEGVCEVCGGTRLRRRAVAVA